MENSAYIDWGRTAIVLIEFQKTWTDKGFLHRLIRKQLQTRSVVENTLKLVQTARARDIKIVHAPLILDKKDKKRYRQFAFFPKIIKAFEKDTWKADFTPGVYDKNDLVVHGRCRFDATICSNLEALLQEHQLQHLYLAGFTTDQCVEITMNTLKARGYHTTLLSDCSATLNGFLQHRVEARQASITGQALIRLFSS